MPRRSTRHRRPCGRCQRYADDTKPAPDLRRSIWWSGNGYRGEIKVLLINHDPADPIVLRRGDRIAQLVIQRVERARFTPVDTLSDTPRGSGGYGSTGGFGG